MHRTLLLSLLLLATRALLAQNGTVAGVITANEGGSVQPMPFVNVIIKGTTFGASTDLDGRYSFPCPAGEHTLLVSFVGFEPVERVITMVAGGTVTADITLAEPSNQLQQVDVVHTVDRERESVLLMERKETDKLVQTIGAQELRRKGATDVAEGVTKMVGMSVMGGRYVFVRGLGDRYNAAYLNGLPLPSPDPDMKVAPLDIIPTDVVGSVSVTKAFSPELYGDFSGGSVDIRTRRAMAEPTLRIQVGGGVNTRTTFGTFRSYNGGGSDFWGRDDRTRELPGGATRPGTNIGGERLLVPVNLNGTTGSAAPDLNFGLSGGTRIRLGEHIALGVIGSASYRNEHRYREGAVRIVNASNAALIDYDVQSWQFNTQSSALAGLNLELGKRHQVSVTSLWVNLSSDEHRVNDGFHFDYADRVHARRYTFRQNSLWVNQLAGHHAFGRADRLTLDWSGSMGTADAAEPDRRQLVYLYNSDGGATSYRFNAIDRLENHRWYSDLQEQELSAQAGAAYRVLQRERDMELHNVLTLRTGYQLRRMERNFGYDILTYDLTGVNAANPGGVDVDAPDRYLNATTYAAGQFTLNNSTGPEADHRIERNINAAHLAAEADLVPGKLKLLTGARFEQGDQRIVYRKQSDSFYQPQRVARIQSDDLLPFLSLRLDVRERHVVRLSGSKTISRPGFREMAPFEYTEFFAGTKNIGNPDLRNGANYNADLRYELYPGPGELLAVGAFGKVLNDPIEKVALATASGQLMSFRNTGQATLAGVEVELVRNIGHLLGRDSSVWNAFSIGMNATYLYSRLEVGEQNAGTETGTVVLTNASRPLQGASPYLLNADLSWTRALGRTLTLTATAAYNVFGARVFAAGANGLGDQYELPVHTLNLILRGDIGRRWQVNLNLRNLLDAPVRVEQETPNGTSLVNEYRTGVGISAGVGFRIL